MPSGGNSSEWLLLRSFKSCHLSLVDIALGHLEEAQQLYRDAIELRRHSGGPVEPLDRVIAENRLRQLPGIGETIADIVTKLHNTAHTLCWKTAPGRPGRRARHGLGSWDEAGEDQRPPQ